MQSFRFLFLLVILFIITQIFWQSSDMFLVIISQSKLRLLLQWMVILFLWLRELSPDLAIKISISMEKQY